MDFRESSQPDYPGSRLPTWRDIAAEFRPRRVGIAGWHMFPHTILTALREAVGAAVSVVPADAVVRAVSMRKSANELRCLREAARLSEIGFRAVLEGIRPGLTECQLVGLATGAMLAAGAQIALEIAEIVYQQDGRSRPANRKSGDHIQHAGRARLQPVAAQHRQHAEEQQHEELTEGRMRDRPRPTRVRPAGHQGRDADHQDR